MKDFVRVAAAVPHVRPADVAGNLASVRRVYADAVKAGAQAVAFPELCLTGYTCADLFYRPGLLADAERALADGKKVAFPRCIPDTHDMEYHFITSLDQLEKGTYGLLEPTPDLPVYDRESVEPTACIVPALVYDKRGFRLGYGKGYYDRYLGSYTGSKVGMIYSEFIIDTVPRGRFDLSVDFIVTERGLKVHS